MDTKKIKTLVGSYARTFIAVATYALLNGESDLQAVLIAGLVAVVGPAIRAANPNDPAFGLLADKVEVELKKVANKPKKTK